MEDKRANFVKIAERRTNEILDKIRSFRKFSNSSYYEYDEKDIDKIANAIIKAVKENIKPLKEKEIKQWTLK